MVDDTKKEIAEYELPTMEHLKLIDSQDLSKASYEELVQMGIDAIEAKGYTQWVLGKLADRIAHPPSEKLAVEGEETATTIQPKRTALKDYANSIGAAYASLTQYAYVYRKYTDIDPAFHPLSYKYGAVPWGVIALVASKSDNPIQLLAELHDAGQTKSIEQAAYAIAERARLAAQKLLEEQQANGEPRSDQERRRSAARTVQEAASG